jgi:hypothetical protein
MRWWKNSMVVRIGRRLVLGASGFAAVAVAVDSDVARGERFAGESSYCGCNQPLRWMVYASDEVVRGCTRRHRVACSQKWEIEWWMQGSRLRLWTISVLCLANKRSEILGERGTRVESRSPPGQKGDQLTGGFRTENSLGDCMCEDGVGVDGQPSFKGFPCGRSRSTSPNVSALMRAGAGGIGAFCGGDWCQRGDLKRAPEEYAQRRGVIIDYRY